MASKPKNINYISPIGTAQWPKLDQPYGWSEAQQRNVPDPEGQFETVLLVPEKDAQPLIASIKQAIEQSGIKPKHVPYKKEEDKDTGEETGNIAFKFKAYALNREGRPNKIHFFDSRARPLPSDIYLTSGSTMRCLGWISVAKMGARLNLKEVQVINLIERQALGFDAVEGEYVYDADEVEDTEIALEEKTNGGSHNF